MIDKQDFLGTAVIFHQIYVTKIDKDCLSIQTKDNEFTDRFFHCMHISLTPQLEARVKSKVASGMYNNASEVIREALRFMDQNEKLIYLLKTERLRYEVAQGAIEAEQGNFSPRTVQDILDDMNS